MKRLLVSLSLVLALAAPAWSQSTAPSPANQAKRTTPIIDVVATAPAPDHAARLKPEPDLRVEPLLTKASIITLDLDRRPQNSGDAGGKLPMAAEISGNSNTVLDARWESQGGWAGGRGLDDQDAGGGFLAFTLRSSLLGPVTFGGGYSRTYSASAAGGGPSPKGALASVRGGGDGGTNYDAMGRWGAFVAVPYQITRNLGLRPEVSYYHGDLAEQGRDAGNEWVMGLRFTFGF